MQDSALAIRPWGRHCVEGSESTVGFPMTFPNSQQLMIVQREDTPKRLKKTGLNCQRQNSREATPIPPFFF